jgi:nitrous oxidase accessory protein NosD
MRNGKILFSLLATLLVSFFSGCTLPGELVRVHSWYVAMTGDDANDCHASVTPCRTIGVVIEHAARGDTIYVAEGTYRESTFGEPAFVINKTLYLVGTGSGPGAVFLEPSRPRGPVLVVTGVNVHPTVENVTIRNGGDTPVGIGVSVEGGAGLTLNHSVIRDNAYTGINFSNTEPNASLTLVDVEITNNAWAGINFWSSDPTAVLSLTNVQVTQNGGGGIMLGGLGSTQIEGSRVSRNTGSSGIVVGTPAFGAGGTLSIRRTTIDGNLFDSSASGIWIGEGSTVLVMDSTISGHENTAIYNEGELTLVNSTVSGNGVGIQNNHSLSLIHSTVAYNFALSLNDMDATRLFLQDSIVLKAAANDCIDNSHMELIREGHNLACWSASDGDLRLGPLANNGGPTQTIALLPGSPAIDAAGPIIGVSADFFDVLTRDQRGQPRTAIDGGDIGAFEVQIDTIAATGVPLPETVTPSIPTVVPAAPNSIPMFTLSQNTNCREGTDFAYKVVVILLQGEAVQIDGRNSIEPRWWWVRIRDSNKHCWVSDSTGSASGSLESQPVIEAPPLVPSDTPVPPIVPSPTATLKYVPSPTATPKK